MEGKRRFGGNRVFFYFFILIKRPVWKDFFTMDMLMDKNLYHRGERGCESIYDYMKYVSNRSI
jgi:hypothetical protein